MKERCSRCGKKARMTCPALEAPLCSYCCGTERGTGIDCTPECLVNPFGTQAYDRFMMIDPPLTEKLFKSMIRSGYNYERMLAESQRFILIAEHSDPMMTGGFGVIHDWIFHQRDEEGRTMFQQWEEHGWPGFSNDERQLLRMRRNTQLTLLELLGVEGDHRTRVRDLLDPGQAEHIIFDYSLVRQFMPFQVLFCHLTPMRHFSCIEANTATVDPSHADDLVAFIREQSGTDEAAAQKAWLRLHAPEVAEENLRLQRISRERLLSGMDFTCTTVVYQSDRDPDSWADFFAHHPEFEEEPDYVREDAMEALYGPVRHHFHWQRQAGAVDAPRTALANMRVRGPGDRVQVLASVYVHQHHLVVSGIDRNLMKWLLQRWTSTIAPGLIVESEGIRDLKASSKSAALQPAIPTRTSPPPLAALDDFDDVDDFDEDDDFEEPENTAFDPVFAAAVMKEYEEEHFRKLIDDPVPALQGKTPREASQTNDPALRKTFETWAKATIHNQAGKARKHGVVAEVFWFYQEIGLPHFWPSDWPR